MGLPAATPKRRLRIDRWQTAVFIIISDLATIVVVGSIELSTLDTIRNSLLYPSIWVTISLIAIAFRVTALIILTDILPIAGDAFAGLFKEDRPDTPEEQGPSEEPSIVGDRQRIKRRSVDNVYYLLLGVGIAAQVLLVAASGGVAESPFIEILIATFILGQVRAPAEASAWTLFFSGLGSAALAHLLFIGIKSYDSKSFESVHYGTAAHVIPLGLVAFMSTLVTVSQIRARLDDLRRRADATGSMEPPPN